MSHENSVDSKKFGAFIMTYERPEILISTIAKIQSQTFSPSYILVVDNSESDRTERLLENLKVQEVGYYRVGYNSGPAGAAKIGLERLTEMGFEWIFWGDDDDPPLHSGIFKSLFYQLEKISRKRNLGAFGTKGGMLHWSGRIKTFSNAQLQEQEFIDVDMIPGGGNLLVNSKVVKKGILPKNKLFFGFEELDFCLQIKNQAFDVVISTREWLEENHQKGRRGDDYKWSDSHLGKKDLLWRSYYSTRNLLYIFWTHNYILAFGILMIKTMIKSFYGFLFGFQYGIENLRIQWTAIWHFFTDTFEQDDIRRRY